MSTIGLCMFKFFVFFRAMSSFFGHFDCSVKFCFEGLLPFSKTWLMCNKKPNIKYASPIVKFGTKLLTFPLFVIFEIDRKIYFNSQKIIQGVTRCHRKYENCQSHIGLRELIFINIGRVGDPPQKNPFASGN